MKLKIYQPKLYLILFASSLFLFSTGCKKYDDGPLISLKSKKSIITNIWILDEVLENGVTAVPQPSVVFFGGVFEGVHGEELELLDNNSASCKKNDQIMREGAWKLNEDKTVLKIDFGISIVVDWEILKLKTKELWVMENDKEYRFIPK